VEPLNREMEEFLRCCISLLNPLLLHFLEGFVTLSWFELLRCITVVTAEPSVCDCVMFSEEEKSCQIPLRIKCPCIWTESLSSGHLKIQFGGQSRSSKGTYTSVNLMDTFLFIDRCSSLGWTGYRPPLVMHP